MKRPMLAMVGFASILCFVNGSPSTTAQGADPEILRCAISAWTVEGVTVYGDADTVIKKLDKYSDSLNVRQHRVYLVTVEAEGHSELALYELKDGKSYEKTSWSTESLGHLAQDIHDAVLKSKGQDCSGEITKNIVKQAGQEHLTTTQVATPQSAKDAAVDLIRAAAFKGKFLRVTVTVLC